MTTQSIDSALRNRQSPCQVDPSKILSDHDRQIQSIPVARLTPYQNNPRTHSKKQIRQIADSIKTFGWTNPILVDANGGVIAGHGRLAAAKLLGMSHVPTLRIDWMSAAQKRAYILADNKLAENAGWDSDLLAIELQGLIDLDVDLDFDIDVIGFESAEIDIMLGHGAKVKVPTEQTLPAIDRQTPAITEAGDLWLLGDHRLLCGNALEVEAYDLLLGGDNVQMTISDPPFNVPIAGHVSGLGATQHPEFAMASGEMTSEEFIQFLQTAFNHMAKFSLDGAVQYIFMDWRHMGELLTAGHAVFGSPLNLCVWNKNNGGMGSLYRSKHELVFVFKNGTAAHINNIELGKHGRYRSNVWDYAGLNSFGADRDNLSLHPTVKPVEMIADAILDCSKPGGVILDPFCGSGTTILAAQKTRRKARVMEVDPHYVDTAIRRWQSLTGQHAIHARSGLTFDQLT